MLKEDLEKIEATECDWLERKKWRKCVATLINGSSRKKKKRRRVSTTDFPQTVYLHGFECSPEKEYNSIMTKFAFISSLLLKYLLSFYLY